MNKKGQAAMEFLMTYGWAILAAIIAIGVLAYFGVFSPGKYTPSATVVNPPFYATGATVNSTAIQIELQNNGGEDVEIRNVHVAGCSTDDTTAVNVTAGSSVVKTVGCSLTSGKNFKGDVTITYRKSGSSLDQTSTGTIAKTVG